ncbi:MAG: hypothetical protein KKA84_10090 [Bacteroidetes bacterium]|nr:hypothetical protein [Bacteroidota bacterium]
MSEETESKHIQIEDTNSSLTATVGHLDTTLKEYIISNDKLTKGLLFLNIVLAVATVIGL